MRFAGRKLLSPLRMAPARSYSNQPLSFVPKKKSVLTRLVRVPPPKPADQRTPTANRPISDPPSLEPASDFAFLCHNGERQEAARREDKAVEHARPEKDNREATLDAREAGKTGGSGGKSEDSGFNVDDFFDDG
ncbi:hypothetical protein B2J93_1935 [Marssonina coronariae]|uniref:Uncharacterized protein n=1 Tax=Diplocarpon coronariae TaxID=2795749 RepID=A0A218YVM7_9HELO|nr:hypothetical protein B2J93_1935 [Marssonina coronariae]